MSANQTLNQDENNLILDLLKSRFEKNKFKCGTVDWDSVSAKLEQNPTKIWSLFQMEETGGEPHLFAFDEEKGEYHFVDCSPESPAGRRSLCYDRKALESRKKFKPSNSAMDLANSMGTEILDEDLYWQLQQNGDFDCKTSSWLKTPDKIRKLGGAIFGDYRFETIFVYHNGAESYYAGRGFRSLLRL